MEHLVYDIRSGDFASAGAASRDLKQHLKRIGAEADAVRRAMIAAYEAEMNVVIHADGGRLEATVSDGQLDVAVSDRGPGIPDVSLAMREGWSTASSEARALGFGAGMGLPNIERSSDRLEVTSTVGHGTRVSFSVRLRPQAADQGARPSSLGVVDGLCNECRHCLVACPTAAIRVRGARPTVMHHVCVDCTSCIAACGTGALTMLDAPGELGGDVLAVPAAFLSGFEGHSPAAVTDALRCLGFDEIVSVHPYEEELRREVRRISAAGEASLPTISPACPAAVNLIEVRFPSLVGNVAQLASPWEALQRDLGGRDVTYVVSCPSQRTALLAQQPTSQRRTVTARRVRQAILPQLARRRADDGARTASHQAPDGPEEVLVVTGASHVLAVLEAIEDGRLPGVPVVEPFTCDHGCFGSPLLDEDACVAAWRWSASGARTTTGGRAYPRARRVQGRPGIRLDADMATAIRKLTQLDAETRALPGRDCGVCGAPTCSALAEDIVMARADRALCPYAAPEEEIRS